MPKSRSSQKWITQKDIDNIKMLVMTKRFTTNYIASITGRSWCTINNIIMAKFNLKEYKKVIAQERKDKKAKRLKEISKLTFKPVKQIVDSRTQKEAVTPQNSANIDPYGNDVLNYMHDLQQEQAKMHVKKAESDEAIHKVRNGLQMISEGLGELL